MSDEDRHLVGYSADHIPAYCHNPACPDIGMRVTVLHETENGQRTITPGECPVCEYPLSLEPAEEEEE